MSNMTQKQAFAKAQKLWGKTACIRDEGKKFASSPEIRQQAWDALNELKKTLPEPKLRTKEQRDEVSRLQWQGTHYRYAVGCVEHVLRG